MARIWRERQGWTARLRELSRSTNAPVARSHSSNPRPVWETRSASSQRPSGARCPGQPYAAPATPLAPQVTTRGATRPAPSSGVRTRVRLEEQGVSHEQNSAHPRARQQGTGHHPALAESASRRAVTGPSFHSDQVSGVQISKESPRSRIPTTFSRTPPRARRTGASDQVVGSRATTPRQQDSSARRRFASRRSADHWRRWRHRRALPARSAPPRTPSALGHKPRSVGCSWTITSHRCCEAPPALRAVGRGWTPQPDRRHATGRLAHELRACRSYGAPGREGPSDQTSLAPARTGSAEVARKPHMSSGAKQEACAATSSGQDTTAVRTPCPAVRRTISNARV